MDNIPINGSYSFKLSNNYTNNKCLKRILMTEKRVEGGRTTVPVLLPVGGRGAGGIGRAARSAGRGDGGCGHDRGARPVLRGRGVEAPRAGEGDRGGAIPGVLWCEGSWDVSHVQGDGGGLQGEHAAAGERAGVEDRETGRNGGGRF
ncbi:hypothetical protein Cni_G26134 [Canna indica]|uniref:Uncharacterized protein n=1 Tax=Canna indica TaxID=4628 RepID=A0AAQ3KYE5_9LILI|nr:hypothetical protein Cni_G26134 [Canna indica]